MEQRPKKLLDQVRDAIRLRHYSIRTEEAYVGWITRFILFHDKRHPNEMAAPRSKPSSPTWPWTSTPPLLRRTRPSARSCSCTARCCARTWMARLTRCVPPSPLLRHPLAGKSLRHSHGPGTAGPQGRQDDQDLHPRAQPWRPGRAQPAGLTPAIPDFALAPYGQRKLVAFSHQAAACWKSPRYSECIPSQ